MSASAYDLERRLRLHALAFRTAILATNRERLPITMREFPGGACGDAALLLAQYLADIGFSPTEYVCGICADGPPDRHSHAWLEFNGIIIDITADQFPEITTPVTVTANRSWHNQFGDVERATAHLELFPGPGFSLTSAFNEVMRHLIPPNCDGSTDQSQTSTR